MSSFDDLAKKYEKKQRVHDVIFEMIQKELGDPSSIIVEKDEGGGRFSFTIDLPSFSPTEAWGDPSTQNRDHINKVFSVVRGGRDISARIADINKFLDPKAARRFRSPGRIINMMMVVEALQACLNDFNESAAGFVFEGFMSALTSGRQQAERVAGTLPIEDFVAFSELGGESVPVSLKLLTAGGVTKGSYTNLVDYLLVRGEPAIKYLLAFKNVGQKQVEELFLFEFVISRENFIQFFEGVGGGRELLAGVKRSSLTTAAANFAADPSDENKQALAALISRTRGYSRGLIDAPEISPEEEEEKLLKRQASREREVEKVRKDVEQLGKLDESFHQKEKRILSEGYGGATQWKASWPQLKSLGSTIGLQSYGSIDLSQDRINELAEIYSEKLKGGVTDLLKETKNLTDNIGSYFREENRGKATAAADTAKRSSDAISDILEKDPRYSDNA
tara:strand:- start:40 stop:1386 length:1347 start_codon:yes stop_codon:yes gene_type:complete